MGLGVLLLSLVGCGTERGNSAADEDQSVMQFRQTGNVEYVLREEESCYEVWQSLQEM